MSSPASRTESRLVSPFPITTFGLLMLATATALLLAGALRRELAAMVWGASFLLLTFYALLGSQLTRRCLKRHLRRALEPLDIRLPSGRLFPGAVAEAEVASELPRLRLPGFQVWFSQELRWHGRPALTIATPLPPGRSSRPVSFFLAYRGLYSSREAALVTRDVLGLSRARLPVPLAGELRVLPAVPPEPELRLRPREGGEVLRRSSRRRRSEELLEVRKYYPGDDLRRVHWKLLAHLQELFLRTGEDSPPPQSRYLALLDLSPSPHLPEAAEADLLDRLIEAWAAAVLALAGQGMQVQVAVTDRRGATTVEKTDRFLGLCAELWWSRRYLVELPGNSGLEVLLYTLPDSEHQQRLLGACAQRDWSVHLFLPELPPPSPPPEGGLRRLLLRPGPAQAPDRRLSDAQRRAYRRALERTEGRLKGKVHASRV
jgi:uncharacterized protein (DUF58 family)